MVDLLSQIENLENLLASFKATIKVKNTEEDKLRIKRAIWVAHSVIKKELKSLVLKEDKHENNSSGQF